MKIFVKAKPRSKETRVEKIDETHFVVAVKEPPVEGKANRAILEALALYFSLPVSRLKIVSGYTSREKVIELPG